MNAVIRIAQIIAGLWFISMTLGALQKMNNEILLLVINMAGMASIALLFGYGRGKRGLRAGWIGWAFMLLVGGIMIMPQIVHSKTLADMLFGLAFAAVFLGIGFYLPYYFGRKIGLQQLE